MTEKPVIGVLGAMQSEVRGLVAAMEVSESGETAGFEYWTGTLAGVDVVVARCGMGKVSAAAGVQHLIDRWRVGRVVVCGLAGGLQQGLRAGDIVVGERFVQYDLDASPIYPRFEVPGLGVSIFESDARLVEAAEAASRSVVSAVAESGALDAGQGSGGSTREQRVLHGLIVTGDQFVKDVRREAILEDFPGALCVEMEGGAIAQVCLLNHVPFVIVRIISDGADESAAVDFTRFVEELAPLYTVNIVRELLPRIV